MTAVLLAVDCGAESGRLMAGELADGRIAMREIHRFANGGHFVEGCFRWDWRRLTDGVLAGLGLALQRYPAARSVAIDTWGVDFGLLSADGELIEEPVHHRDARGQRVAERLDGLLGSADRFRASGIRQLPINSLDQLVALRLERPAVLAEARQVLFAPDLLAWELTGVAAVERSIASTSACYAPGAEAVADSLLTACGLPSELFAAPVASGTVLGGLRSAVIDRCGGGGAKMQVLATAGHDTAAAVAAVPAPPGPVCYLSSGTWSLMGTLVDTPLLDDDARLAGLTNEVAWDGRIRLLKNIMGLWIVQECRRGFAVAGRSYGYPELTALAETADAPARVLAVDDPRFLGPGTPDDPMPERVRSWYRDQGVAVPEDDGAIIRAVLDGLASAYARSLADLERVTGQSFAVVHVVGGGCRNAFLNRLTARACGRPVVAGPAEATSLGNLLVQAVGLGLVQPADLPTVVRRSVTVTIFEP